MDLVVATLAGLLLSYLALLAALWIARPGGDALRESLRLLPDVARLVSRLARDRTVPRHAAVGLWLLLGYLVLPFDLVPDVIPVLGFADDVILTTLVLRRLLRSVPAATIRAHWPGTEAGLEAVGRLFRCPGLSRPAR